MGTSASVPNINITGATGAGSFSTGGPGNMNFGNSANPSAPANPTAVTPQGQTGIAINNLYGSGIGALLSQYLASNGGFNSAITNQTVSAQSNAAQTQTQLGADNLTSMLAAMGITGGSSSLPQSLSTYEANATTGENAIAAQDYYNMWNQSQSNQLSVLNNVFQTGATNQANQPNWMDYATFALGLLGAV